MVARGGEDTSLGGLFVNALLVRVGADQSEGGGHFNGPVDSRTRQFVYVPIPETAAIRVGMATSYSLVAPAVHPFGVMLPGRLTGLNMHLDPDFRHLTYGDQGRRALQIQALTRGDLIVFYAGLRDIHPSPRLVYAIIGLYVVDNILQASMVPSSQWPDNAHTRRILAPGAKDIVVRAQLGISGRLDKCMPIGSFRPPAARPDKCSSYRVEPRLLTTWAGLNISDGYLQRSGYLPPLLDAKKFYTWFQNQRPRFMTANN